MDCPFRRQPRLRIDHCQDGPCRRSNLPIQLIALLLPSASFSSIRVANEPLSERLAGLPRGRLFMTQRKCIFPISKRDIDECISDGGQALSSQTPAVHLRQSLIFPVRQFSSKPCQSGKKFEASLAEPVETAAHSFTNKQQLIPRSRVRDATAMSL